MGKNCSNIREIWYCFKEEFPKEEIENWKRDFLKSYDGRIVCVTDDVNKRKADFIRYRERGQTLFLISDSSRLCKLAGDCGIPFLVYPDSAWEDISFPYVTYGVEALNVITPEFVEQISRRFYHEPWEILQTDRCLVRETTEEDTDALYEMYKAPSITLYTEGLYEDKEQERIYIREYIKNVYEFYGFGIWTVILKETGELIGRAGLTYREGFDMPELGYVIAVGYQRQGIATEVCSAILKYGFDVLGFREIRALFDPENTASEKLCQKIGLKKDCMQLIDGVQMQQYKIKKEAYAAG